MKAGAIVGLVKNGNVIAVLEMGPGECMADRIAMVRHPGTSAYKKGHIVTVYPDELVTLTYDHKPGAIAHWEIGEATIGTVQVQKVLVSGRVEVVRVLIGDEHDEPFPYGVPFVTDAWLLKIVQPSRFTREEVL